MFRQYESLVDADDLLNGPNRYYDGLKDFESGMSEMASTEAGVAQPRGVAAIVGAVPFALLVQVTLKPIAREDVAR